jgi:ABC-type transporter Mla maintaining outer membrane lipid asymmetry ATPase subunit MlaF
MLRPELVLLDNPLSGLDLRHSNWWLNLLDNLNAGHPWMGNRRTTLVVTVSDLRPWKGRARQFAALHEKRLKPLGTWSELTIMSEQMVNDLLRADTREV